MLRFMYCLYQSNALTLSHSRKETDTSRINMHTLDQLLISQWREQNTHCLVSKDTWTVMSELIMASGDCGTGI